MRRWLKRTAAVLTLVVVLAVGVVAYVVVASLPRVAGEISVEGIQSAVHIDRDAFGVPTIRAESLNDLYFGLGFVHAQDRLWQMEFSRRLGQGRLSEILGQDALPADRFMRTLGLYHAAQNDVPRLSEESRQYLDSYAIGINSFLASHGGTLPPEFQIFGVDPEPWRPADSVVMAKLLALDLSKNWRDEANRFHLADVVGADALHDLWPQTLGEWPKIENGLSGSFLPVPADNQGLGSNIWAVNGEASASGNALLANDPHLRLQAPGVWYLAKLQAPGIRAVGATVPAMPVLVIGRNEHIAWGMTNSGADVQDLFIETADPDNPENYLTPDGSAIIDVRQEPISIKGGQVEQLTVRRTRHGPIVSDLNPSLNADKNDILALQWTAIEVGDRTLAAGFGLLSSTNFEELTRAIEKFDSPPQNVFFADRKGHIGHLLAGKIPIRKSDDGWLPKDGASGKYDWTGYLPTQAKPTTIDPESGIIANANNQIVDDDYPFLLTQDWDPDDRIRRISAVLSEAKHGLSEAKALQGDIHSTLADDFSQFIAVFADRHDAIAALAAWDRQMDRDSPEALLFQAWYRAWVETVFADELGDQYARYRGTRARAMAHILENAEQWCDDRRTSQIEDCETMAWTAFEIAMEKLSLAYGDDWRAWRWGEASQVHMAHQPFSKVPLLNRLFDIRVEKGGGPTSPNVSSFSAGKPFATIAAASMRMIVDWDDPDAIHIIASTGQSGHPFSPHYRDLTPIWANGDYLRLKMPSAQPQGPSADGEQDRLKLTPKASHIASSG